jgi:hypothetical protein
VILELIQLFLGLKDLLDLLDRKDHKVILELIQLFLGLKDLLDLLDLLDRKVILGHKDLQEQTTKQFPET